MPEATPRTANIEPGTSNGVRFAIIAGAIVIVFLVTWATYVVSTTTVNTIEVNGAHHAPIEIIVSLSGVHHGESRVWCPTDLIAPHHYAADIKPPCLEDGPIRRRTSKGHDVARIDRKIVYLKKVGSWNTGSEVRSDNPRIHLRQET